MSITRYHRQRHGEGDFKRETRHFITSLAEGETSHARLAQIGRCHWSVENRNHWRKDATLWREDRCPRRKPNGAKNLALLRNAILALIEPDRHESLNQAFLHHTSHRSEAIRLLTKTPPHNP